MKVEPFTTEVCLQYHNLSLVWKYHTNPNWETVQMCSDHEKKGKTEKLPLIGEKNKIRRNEWLNAIRGSGWDPRKKKKRKKKKTLVEKVEKSE